MLNQNENKDLKVMPRNTHSKPSNSIILYGPPGIGKSTIIKALKAKGLPAVDLEDVYPNPLRFKLPEMFTGHIFGAADLNPKSSVPGAFKILLVLPQQEYEARRAARDKDVPGKGNQRKHTIDQWLNGVKYDKIVTANDKAVEYIASLYRKFIKKV